MRAVEFAATERWTAMAEEMVGLGYWRLDADTRAIQWSANMYRIFGFDPSAPPTLEEAMSRIHPADSEAVNITLEQALIGSDGPTRSRLVMPDGSVRFIEGRNGVERDAAGRVVAVFGTTLDVTDRTLAESKVIESERRYRLLTDNATDIIFSLKPDGAVIFVSPAISRILGHDPADPDTLLARLGGTPGELSTRLLILELAGDIERLPGGMVQRVTK